MPPASLLPPIEDPTIEDSEDDKSQWEWYFGENAGGCLLWFGKHKGKKLHQIPESYLRWCLENLNHPHVLTAVKSYHTGLQELTRTDYDRFIVPFGAKHKGQTIRQCRDKPWLEWATKQPGLVKEFPLFFLAVNQWLGNPRKYGVQRDIGELLRISEYRDDMNLNTQDSDDESTLSENGFIDDSEVNADDMQQNSQESDMDTDDETQETGERSSQELDMDSNTNEGSPHTGMSENDNITMGDSEEDSQMEDVYSSSPSPNTSVRQLSYVEITPRKNTNRTNQSHAPPERRVRKTASPKSWESTGRGSPFIVEDERSDSGSQSYRESSEDMSDSDDSVSRRVTRSSAKAQNSAPKPKVNSASHERPSRLYKKVYIDTAHADDEDSQVPIARTPRRARPPLVILSDSEASDGELPLSRNLFSQTRAQ